MKNSNKMSLENLNLNFYSGEDNYSDGSIEDEILEIVKNDMDIAAVLATSTRWPILCHLAPQRRNLLEWYGFDREATLLEIGAGCGALTGLFCERVKKVTAIELSLRRGQIIAHSHKHQANLEIIIGNFNDISFEEKFDYITLVGVLEYARKFTDSRDPVTHFLGKVKQLLKPGGVLILGIENKFGLKYWAGCHEDHTGNIFEGLEDYTANDEIVTFSKKELNSLLSGVGFQDLEYYYPMPDYKLPKQIFSDDYLPSFDSLEDYSPNYDRDRMKLFNEKLVFNNLLSNNEFGFFANSFLIFCR